MTGEVSLVEASPHAVSVGIVSVCGVSFGIPGARFADAIAFRKLLRRILGDGEGAEEVAAVSSAQFLSAVSLGMTAGKVGRMFENLSGCVRTMDAGCWIIFRKMLWTYCCTRSFGYMRV